MTSFSFSGSKFRYSIGLGVLAICLLLLSGCVASTGDQVNQPYNRPLSESDFFADGRSARMLVPGTVPQTTQQGNDPAITGVAVDGKPLEKMPVPITSDLVKRGEERYSIYCVVCHGADGHGDGKAVAFGMTKPPDLLSVDVKAFSDGYIYGAISNGQGAMLSYGYRVKPPDRWAIIAYLRAMQLKNGHLTQDLTPAELQQLGK